MWKKNILKIIIFYPKYTGKIVGVFFYIEIKIFTETKSLSSG